MQTVASLHQMRLSYFYRGQETASITANLCPPKEASRSLKNGSKHSEEEFSHSLLLLAVLLYIIPFIIEVYRRSLREKSKKYPND